MLYLWSVAKSTFQVERKRPKFGIFKKNGTPFALVLIGVKKFWFFEHTFIHRGPIWLTENPTQAEKKEVLTLLKKSIPTSWSKKLTFMPEFLDTTENTALLQALSLKQTAAPAYASALLTLTPSIEALKKSCRKNWLGQLKKSEKAQIKYHIDQTYAGFKLFLRGYRTDKRKKKYKGPSLYFLLQLFKNAYKGELLLLEAWHEGSLIGAQLFCIHGKTATYFVAWTTDEGRKLGAHNGLLFEAIKKLKAKNITTLDLGGLSATAPQLNYFKLGTGAKPYTLVGTWKHQVEIPNGNTNPLKVNL